MFLMLCSLEKTYKRFREAVGQDVQIHDGRVAGENIQFWLSYATRLRRQIEETGEHLKSQIMLSVAETISGMSVGIYLVLRFSQTAELTENLVFTIGYAMYSLDCALRLYVKAYLAERINSEVNLQITWRFISLV